MSASEQDSTRAARVQKKKRPYQPPRLKCLGTVARLTRGAGGNSADFMNNRFKRL